MKVRYLPPVAVEAKEASQYYDAIHPQLGQRLIDEFEASVSRIQHFPLDWRPIDPDLRQCVVKGFPYVVIYALRKQEIIVVALANTHRRPGYWRNRLKTL